MSDEWRWSSFRIDSERDQLACKSWFIGLIGPEDTVLLAEGYETDDGAMPRLRALVRRADGTIAQAVRNNRARGGAMIKLMSPQAAFLKHAAGRYGVCP